MAGTSGRLLVAQELDEADDERIAQLSQGGKRGSRCGFPDWRVRRPPWTALASWYHRSAR